MIDWNFDMSTCPPDTRVLLYFKHMPLVTVGFNRTKAYRGQGRTGWLASIYPANKWEHVAHPNAWAPVPAPPGE